MQARGLRKLVLCLVGLLVWPFAYAASLPDGALLQVYPFTFPKAAYQGAEEAERLSSAFYHQMLAALEQAGISIDVALLPEDVAGKEVLPDNETLSSVVIDAEEKPEAAGDEETEKDTLMQLVKEAETENPEAAVAGRENAAAGKNRTGQPARTNIYRLTGKVIQYEEKVGAPVSTGRNRRTRTEVIFSGRYRVTTPEGTVLANAPFSFALSRIVPETADIHVVLQELSSRGFSGVAHEIARQVAGQEQVSPTQDDVEPGSEDDEYADSPGKRLKSGSGRMKWVLH